MAKSVSRTEREQLREKCLKLVCDGLERRHAALLDACLRFLESSSWDYSSPRLERFIAAVKEAEKAYGPN